MLPLLLAASPPTPAYPMPFFLPHPALLSGSAGNPGQSGRCLLITPPGLPGTSDSSADAGVCVGGAGVVPPQPVTPRAAVNTATPVCPASTPLDLASRSTTLLISLCVPRPPGAPAPPNEPLAPSLLPTCAAFLDTSAAAATLTQLAAVLSVPPATLFLRSCLDTSASNPGAAAPTLSGRRYIWRWGSQSSAAPSETLEVLGARGALQNATRRANSNCSCNAVATYALMLGAAEPGQWSLAAPGVMGADTLPPLPSLTSSTSVMYLRARRALDILAGSALNTSVGLPLLPWIPPAVRALAAGGVGGAAAAHGGRQLFEPTGGFSPLRCSASSLQLLDACFDDSADEGGGEPVGNNGLGIPPDTIVSGLYANDVWTPFMLAQKNMLTMCGCVRHHTP